MCGGVKHAPPRKKMGALISGLHNTNKASPNTNAHDIELITVFRLKVWVFS